MLDRLGCGPGGHPARFLEPPVRTLMPAHDLGIRNKVFVAPWPRAPRPRVTGYQEINDIGGLPGLGRSIDCNADENLTPTGSTRHPGFLLVPKGPVEGRVDAVNHRWRFDRIVRGSRSRPAAREQ